MSAGSVLNTLQSERRMHWLILSKDTKEVAAALGLKDNSSVTRVAKKCLPNKRIEHGKPTYWNEEELTILIAYLRNAGENQHVKSLLHGSVN